MEARRAVQGVLRTAAATSSTRVTATLLALRQTTPASRCTIRQQSSSSSSAAAAAPAEASSTTTTTSSSSSSSSSSSTSSTPGAWPAPNPSPAWLDTRSPASWIKPGAPRSGSTVGGRSTRDYLLNSLKLPARGVQLGAEIPAEVARQRRAGLPGPQTFDPASFAASHRLAARAEWNKKLRPSLGRTVPCGANVDASRAFNLLGMLVRRNNVSRDMHRQRFHERPGLRRKRLKSQRWRARFKHSFQATVSRIRMLTKQGW